jgi:hypothetical protein
MHVRILAAENIIIVDGKGMQLDCMTLRSKLVSIITWYGERGEIEYVGGRRVLIKKLDAFQPDGFTLQALIDAGKPFGTQTFGYSPRAPDAPQ